MRGEETIAAIATGLGESGVGIVRISGPAARAVGNCTFRPRTGKPLSKRKSHTLVYGWVVDSNGDPIDEALGAVMAGPRSFTGEDVVEIHCHGGQVAVCRVLEVILQAGARLAEPGEFTRRAFLSGRMDLSQAEAVIDIIRAKTDRALNAAVNQLRGELGGAVRTVRDVLLELMAHLEADIDFPELELEVQTHDQVLQACESSLGHLRELMAGTRQGKLLREGLRVVLAGRPNVGKSSLMNRLVRENRSIVTEIPGTTRDVVEEWISLDGVPVVLADTAGIRETSDVVERMSISRSRTMLEMADLVLVVVDSAVGVSEEDRQLLAMLPPGTSRILVANKMDLVPDTKLGEFQQQLGVEEILGISAESGLGIVDLERAIARVGGLVDVEGSFVANARHEDALRRAIGHLESALVAQTAGFGSDLISIDIRSAWAALGEITGETVGEDLLDQIFSRFCIGK